MVKLPVKGDSVKLKDSSNSHHCVVFITSNLPDVETFRKVQKESGVSSRWSTQDYEKNLGLIEGRVGCLIRTETAVPAIVKKALVNCPRCAARFIRWTIKRYLMAHSDTIPIPRENIWQDSDDSYEEKDSHIDETTEFWSSMHLDGERL